MIEALVGGKLLAKPTSKTGSNNKSFVLARMTTTSHTAESVTVSIITFEEDAQKTLLAMDKGDQLTVTGNATPKLWEDPKGEKHTSLDLVPNQLS